jgi:hypothetical protein
MHPGYHRRAHFVGGLGQTPAQDVPSDPLLRQWYEIGFNRGQTQCLTGEVTPGIAKHTETIREQTWGLYGMVGGLLLGAFGVAPLMRCEPLGRCQSVVALAALAPVAGSILGKQLYKLQG